MPGDVKFEARVAPLALAHLLPYFDSQILTSMPHKRQFFGPFLGFDWGSFASKTSSFSAFQNAKSFVCTRSVGSFPLFSIFFAFPRLFPPCRGPLAYPCRRRLPAPSCDNSNRLPRVGGHVKRKGRGLSPFFCLCGAIHQTLGAIVSAALVFRCLELNPAERYTH